MSQTSKGGRPKGSRSAKESTLIPLGIELGNFGGTRSGARAELGEPLYAKAAEIED